MAVVVPRSLDEAVGALGAAPGATVLAGGTDLMVGINAGAEPGDVVALSGVAALRGWEADDTTVRLGAGMTYTDLLAPGLRHKIPGLAQAARTVGSPQIRNAGTIGGNLGTASPAGDTLPVLAALDAVVELIGLRGARLLRLDEFITGPKQTARQPDELIAAVLVPVATGPQEYLKVGVRNAMVIAIASLALVVHDGAIGVGLGSVGPVPIRLHADDSISAAELVEEVVAAARPIDDHRATAAYRRHAVSVLAERALRRARAA